MSPARHSNRHHRGVRPLLHMRRDAADLVQSVVAAFAGVSRPTARGSVQAILAAVDADEPPTRLLLSSAAVDIVPPIMEKRLADWRAWEDVARSADAS